MEYEFGEGDYREYGGGGLESYLKFRNEFLYRVFDSKIKMKDVREVILALALDNFIIFLSICFNYIQNFRKGIFEVRRYYEGRGVNVCLFFYKVLDIVLIKEKVINIYWISLNVNYVLDKVFKELNIYCVNL